MFLAVAKNRNNKKMPNKTFYSSLVFLLITSVIVLLLNSRNTPSVVQTNLENLPMEIMGFVGKEDFFSLAVYEELNADKHVYRHYSKEGWFQIDLYIGYYGTAKGGRTPHNPYGCLPGQGWTIIEVGKKQITTSYAPDGVEINSLHSRNNDIDKYMLHWYQSAGNKVLHSGIKQNIQRFKGRVFENRNDGAYVQVSIVAAEAQQDDAQVMLNEFAHKILELLPEYWPEEH